MVLFDQIFVLLKIIWYKDQRILHGAIENKNWSIEKKPFPDETTQTSNFSSATKIIIKISRKLKKKFFDTEKKKFKLNSIQTQLLYCTTWYYYNVNFSRKSAIKRFIKEKLWWDTLIFQPCCSETFCKVKAKLANQKCFPGNSNSLCWVSYEES